MIKIVGNLIVYVGNLLFFDLIVCMCVHYMLRHRHINQLLIERIFFLLFAEQKVTHLQYGQAISTGKIDCKNLCEKSTCKKSTIQSLFTRCVYMLCTLF